jgi:hypothetical protein
LESVRRPGAKDEHGVNIGTLGHGLGSCDDAFEKRLKTAQIQTS